jgi:glycosyltransferase involved in cell wall biosynthesis
MKILMLSPVPTHPPIAGNRARILTLVDSLKAAGHTVHFAWAALESGDRIAMMKHFGEGFTELLYSAPKPSLLTRLRRRVQRQLGRASAYVSGVDDWYDAGLTPQLEALHAQHGFDAVCVEYVFMSKALDAFPANVLKILDTHDRFADRHLHYLRAGRQPEWFSTTPEGERAGLARADVVLAIQDSEAALFTSALRGQARVLTVGHLLDMSQSVLLADALRAVFVASANSINVDGANAFITEVLPLIRAKIADFEFWLAGDVCLHALDAPGVHKLGRVESVAQTYAQGALAVNPVRMGTGLNIKTMECLALGVPLVATASGSRGLENLRGRAFLAVADNDAAAMAAAVIRVLREEMLRATLMHEALAAAQAWNLMQLENLAGALQHPAAQMMTRGCTQHVEKSTRMSINSNGGCR